jgi:nitrogen-specific signal transduction histidine kinase
MRWKFILFLLAVAIGFSSLYYTNKLVKQLKAEEKKKVQLWAAAIRQVTDLEQTAADYSFAFDVIENNNTLPVILINEDSVVVASRNIDEKKLKDHKTLLKQLKKMEKDHPPMEIDLGDGSKNIIYYQDSTLLTKLKYFPYVQLTVIMLFILVAYLAFSAARRSEQNQVWLGLSKETAHQLGTPTSSLLAWLEILKTKKVDPELIQELEKDVKRLEKITERFSKIGSRPVMKETDIKRVINNVIEYMKKRTSEKVKFRLNFKMDDELVVPANEELFEWVIENLSKNAVDAMKGEGTVDIFLTDNTQFVYVDVKDQGSGIPKSKYKEIFKPGYTTKHRSWGLGLSLSKRIVEEYHNGRLFVNYSEPGTGTVFRIVLPKKTL